MLRLLLIASLVLTVPMAGAHSFAKDFGEFSRAATEGRQEDDEHPLQKDKTGLKWELPFKKAREKAEKENRILLIKPVAFGTSKNGGW